MARAACQAGRPAPAQLVGRHYVCWVQLPGLQNHTREPARLVRLGGLRAPESGPGSALRPPSHEPCGICTMTDAYPTAVNVCGGCTLRYLPSLHMT